MDSGGNLRKSAAVAEPGKRRAAARPKRGARDRQEDMARVYRLWDEVARFPCEKTDEALKYLTREIKHLLDADNVRWLATVRVVKGAAARKDVLQGWRMRGGYTMVPLPPKYLKYTAWWFQHQDRAVKGFPIGLATETMIKGMGKFQVHRMRDGWIPFREFRESEHYKLHYTALNLSDRIWLSFPLNGDAESLFLVDRHGRSAHFSKADADLAALILRGLAWFHRRLFLDHGLLIGDEPLSPTSRRILQKLLTGMTEKEIAGEMNQTLSTTHSYIKTIYRRFGVQGRAGLMALWLGSA